MPKERDSIFVKADVDPKEYVKKILIPG